MKSIEEQIFELKFKGEEFNPNDYNDWAKENEGEAYKLCLQIAKQLQESVEETVQCECGAIVPLSIARMDDDACWYCTKCIDSMEEGKFKPLFK